MGSDAAEGTLIGKSSNSAPLNLSEIKKEPQNDLMACSLAVKGAQVGLPSGKHLHNEVERPTSLQVGKLTKI